MTKAVAPSISLSYPERFEGQRLQHLLEGSDAIGIKVEQHPQKPGFTASWSLAEPGQIVLWVASAVFTGALAEFGAEGYKALRCWFVHVTKASRALNMARASAEENEPKADEPQYSKAVSIYFQSITGPIIKLVYDDSHSSEQWAKLTEDFVDLMQTHYWDHPNDQLSRALDPLKEKHTVFAVMADDGWKIGEAMAFLPPEAWEQGN